MEREIEMQPRSNLESVVYTLLAAKARGEHVFFDFNGHILHSDTVSMDSAYMEVMGCTKAEHDQKMNELSEKSKKEQNAVEQKTKESIPLWIERGKALIFPEKYAEWEQCVQTRATDLYHGTDLDSALEIMEALNKGVSMEEAKKIFDSQGHSGMSGTIVKNIIFAFSSKGPEFCESTIYGEIPPESKQIFEAKKQENQKLAEAHAKIDESGRHM